MNGANEIPSVAHKNPMVHWFGRLKIHGLYRMGWTGSEDRIGAVGWATHEWHGHDRGTGYDVVLWIEEQVALNGFVPPAIKVHSANVAASENGN